MATCYPWTEGSPQYSGYGDAYQIETSLSLRVSEMPYQYFTNSCRFKRNIDEMAFFRNPCAGRTFSCEAGDNLGN